MATIRHHAHIDATPDDDLRRFQYRIASGDMPVEFHLGTIDVLDVDDRALVVYSTDVAPDEVAEQMDGIVAEGLKASRRTSRAELSPAVGS